MYSQVLLVQFQDVYDSDEAFKIVKQKIEEENNTGEDAEKSDETTGARNYRYPDPGQSGTTLAKKGIDLHFVFIFSVHLIYYKLLTLCFFKMTALNTHFTIIHVILKKKPCNSFWQLFIGKM